MKARDYLRWERARSDCTWIWIGETKERVGVPNEGFGHQVSQVLDA